MHLEASFRVELGQILGASRGAFEDCLRAKKF